MKKNRNNFMRMLLALMCLTMAPFTMQGQLLVGDVDNDSRVSIEDVTTLIDYLLTGNADLINEITADVNDDRRVSIDDVTGLIDMLLIGNYGNIEVIVVNSTVRIRMVKVTGGTYWMGAGADPAGEASSWELPSHKVTVSTFSIGETEVTQQLWQAVMGNNHSRFTGNEMRPVEGVSWNDCQQFISKLNAITGKTFRLPTEAEWEFAARGGNKSKGYSYAGSNDVAQVAWQGYNTGGSECMTHLVASLAPNEIGIYDMSGNVWEWCQDWYGPYSNGEQVNPKGPATGVCKVFRGGCWSSESRYCRVSERFYFVPSLSGDIIGLRLAL